jgi:hypothetical protein
MAISIIRELNARIAAMLAKVNGLLVVALAQQTTGDTGSLIYDAALSTAKATPNKIQESLDKFNMTTGGTLSSTITTRFSRHRL